MAELQRKETNLCLVGQGHQLLLDVLMEPHQLGHVLGLERADGVLHLQDRGRVLLGVLFDLPEVRRSFSSNFNIQDFISTKMVNFHFIVTKERSK